MPTATRSSLSSAIGTPALVKIIRKGRIEHTPEIQATWDRYKSNRNIADFHCLVEHYSPMVLHVAMRLQKRSRFYSDRLDELLSDGICGLMAAIHNTPLDGGISGWMHWSRKRIYGWILRGSNKRHTGMESLDAEPAGEDALPLNKTVASDVDEPFQPLMNAEVMRLLMRGLSPIDKKLLRRFLRGDSGTDMARSLGLSRQRAHQLLNRLLWNLLDRRDVLEYLGLDPATVKLPSHLSQAFRPSAARLVA